MRTVVLISCVSKKLNHNALAAELYISPLFRLNLAYAKKLHPDAIYILSAKYGLLRLDDAVEPYDLTLNEMRNEQVRAWAHLVLRRLQEETDLEADHFVFLAGANYRKYLPPHLKSYEVPLEGLRIGEQLGQLRRWLDE
jgi:cytoplasmic iron level regulating protein YaaA (DUF328/UPF0246 family)